MSAAFFYSPASAAPGTGTESENQVKNLRSNAKAPAALAALMCLLCWNSTVRAVNPADWTFSLETHGQNVSWQSPTNVDAGFAQYAYQYQITQFDVQLGGILWQNGLPLLGTDVSGSGVSAGGLPVTVLSGVYSDATTGSSATLDIGVDAGGAGHASITDITFGSFLGTPITGVRTAGTMQIQGVPEPTTLVWAAAGILGLRRRKR